MNQTTDQLVEHFFRHESAALIAVLTRVFGLSNLPLVEDTVQAALLEALQNWKINGVPSNPAGWVHRVAKNKAIDVIRRQQRERDVTERLAENFARSASRKSAAEGLDAAFDQPSLDDSLLQMIFACCSPVLDRHSQIAISLKILCGFHVREIASALLISPEAAKKRVQRAKSALQSTQIRMEFPDPQDISHRLAAVHEVLYLMFNEGYSTTTGDQTIRQDLCEEAARLCHLLCQKKTTSNANTRALLAMMLFHAARFQSRTSTDGSIVLLQDQDRSQWDSTLIQVAKAWLSKSADPSTLSTYHLEAGIALQHCQAEQYSDTNWGVIVKLYDRLIELLPTPIYKLNRAIAKAEIGETKKALNELLEVAEEKKVAQYSHLHCALAHVYRLQDDHSTANQHLRRALELATSQHERRFIENQLAKYAP